MCRYPTKQPKSRISSSSATYLAQSPTWQLWVSKLILLSAPFVCSDPRHLVLTITGMKALAGIKVGDCHPEAAVKHA